MHPLLAEIYAAPDDDGPRSIYADYLIEQGDPRGTFIALQLARAQRRDAVVSAEEQALLDAHWRAWIGEPAAHIDAGKVSFERGFWAELEMPYVELPADVLAHPSWGTVSRVQVGFDSALPAMLAATARALRSIWVPSREALAVVARSNLPIEELVLMLDESRDPPALPQAITRLPALRRLGFQCTVERAVRWVERANDLGIRDVLLKLSPSVDYVRKILRRTKRTQIAKLAIAIPADTVIHAERDEGGTFAVRALELRPTHVTPEGQIDSAKQWLVDLAVHVDPGVTITMPSITPALVQYAEARGMRLDLADSHGSLLPSVRSPIILSETPLAYGRPSPRLGEHTREVLTGLLGYTAADIERLASDGVI